MTSKTKKFLTFLSAVAKKPSLINLILTDREVQREKFLQKYQNYAALPQVQLKDLGTASNLPAISTFLLDGSSLATDLQLLMTLSARSEIQSYFEIGTWRGESVYNVAKILNDCTTLNLSEEEMKEMGWAEKYAEQHGILSRLNSKILHLEGNTQNFDFAGLNKRYDLIFIDGDHTYEMVKNDTKKVFEHLVHDNSIVVWHDYAYSPQKIRYEVFRGILDGLEQKNHAHLYHPENTLCAVYFKGKIECSVFDEMKSADKIFEVTLTEESFPR